MAAMFSNDEIRGFLAGHGYTCSPGGFLTLYRVDFNFETDGVMYLDVPPEAIRKGNEMPDRPVRVTFTLTLDGGPSTWKLKSVEELAPGIKSRALDRLAETPKISPWPATNQDK
jgi:hypothetical protein